MNVLEELVFREREAIEFCIDNGIETAKSQLKSFEKNNKLTGTNQKIALKLNLATFADEVEMTGKGTDRVYTLRGLKTSPTNRITGNVTNGRKPTDLDLIMDEGIMRGLTLRIKNNESVSYTINSWTDNLFLFRIGDGDYSALGKTFVKKYGKYLDEEKLVNMLKIIEENIQTRRTDVIKRSFKKLEYDGRIFTTKEYMEEEYIDPELHSEEEYKKWHAKRFKDISY